MGVFWGLEKQLTFLENSLCPIKIANIETPKRYFNSFLTFKINVAQLKKNEKAFVTFHAYIGLQFQICID